MKKVSILLKGGLGNYMFQIACAYSYAKKNNKECFFTTNDAVKIHKYIDSYRENVLKNVPLIESHGQNGFKRYNEPTFHFTEIPNIEGDVYLDGYFQSEKYFNNYSEDIRKLFKFPEKLKGETIIHAADKFKDDFNGQTCSIHVRRGDYLNSPDHHPTQDVSYYMKAAKKIGMDKKFLVFSDDIQWCKENFPEMDNFIFIEGLKDYEDLLLMSLCKHNIICNSSFSWWAAWLNQNSEKIVIAPQKWFGAAYGHLNTQDLYCEGWLKI